MKLSPVWGQQRQRMPALGFKRSGNPLGRAIPSAKQSHSHSSEVTQRLIAAGESSPGEAAKQIVPNSISWRMQHCGNLIFARLSEIRQRFSSDTPAFHQRDANGYGAELRPAFVQCAIPSSMSRGVAPVNGIFGHHAALYRAAALKNKLFGGKYVVTRINVRPTQRPQSSSIFFTPVLGTSERLLSRFQTDFHLASCISYSDDAVSRSIQPHPVRPSLISDESKSLYACGF